MMVSRYNKRLGAYKEEDILSPVRLAHAPFARVKMFWFLLLDSSVTFTSFTHARKCLLVPLFLECVELGRVLSPDSALAPVHRALRGVRINPRQLGPLGLGSPGGRPGSVEMRIFIFLCQASHSKGFKLGLELGNTALPLLGSTDPGQGRLLGLVYPLVSLHLALLPPNLGGQILDLLVSFVHLRVIGIIEPSPLPGFFLSFELFELLHNIWINKICHIVTLPSFRDNIIFVIRVCEVKVLFQVNDVIISLLQLYLPLCLPLGHHGLLLLVLAILHLRL